LADNLPLRLAGAAYLTPGPTNTVSCALDELAIYDYVMPQTQVREHYLLGLPAFPASDSGTSIEGGESISIMDRSYESVILSDSPVAYWRLNESSGTVSRDLIAGRDLTATGSPNQNVAGPLATGENAIQFNGTTQYLSRAYDAALNPPAPFSAECWFKWDGTGQGGTYKTIFGERTSGSLFGWGMWMTTGTGILTLGMGNGSVASSWAMAGNWVPTPGGWYHLVLAYDGATAKVYINTVQMLNQAYVGFAPNTTTRFSVGVIPETNTLFWPGLIDEVALYNYALQPDEVNNHFKAASYPKTTNPASDSGTLGEAVGLARATPDAGTGTEGTPLLTITYGDTGTAVESAFADRDILVADTGGGFDTTGNTVSVTADTGTASETTLPIRITATDTGTAIEVANANYSQSTADAGFSIESIFDLDAALNFGQDYPSTVIADTPVAFWRMEERSGLILRDVIGSHDLTMKSASNLNAPGILALPNTCVEWTGASNQNAGRPFDAALVSQIFSIEMWIYPMVTPAANYRLIAQNDSNLRGIECHLTSGGGFAFYIFNGTTNTIISTPLIVGPLNTWYHVVFAYNGTNTAWIFVNGVQRGFSSAVSTYVPASTPSVDFTLGGTQIGTATFPGRVDECAFYNYALTLAQ
ncbi:MAG TPA: LamG domain-containing protein, partial [Ktedonobacteraceae bacterium]